MAKLVENVYGNALFELSVEQHKEDEYYREAMIVNQAIQDNPQLIKMMIHPQIVMEQKLAMVDTIFKTRVADEIVGLLRMVVKKNHFAEVESIFSYFIARMKEYKKIGVVKIKTPQALSDAQKKEVEQRLLETTSYESFEMHYEVAPELIGGMVIQMKDRVVDSSIQSKIYRLSQDLSKIQLKAGESTP